MSNNWNFVPKKLEIFKEDKDNDIIYRKWSWGSGYVVNDEDKQNKLLNIEGYRGFICSYRAPIILPIILLAFMLGGAISLFVETNMNLKQLVVYISFGLYSISCIIYISKINKILKGCKKKY